LALKLKKLIAKEFKDLSSYMGGMENKLAMENMIRVREAEIKFDKAKEEAL